MITLLVFAMKVSVKGLTVDTAATTSEEMAKMQESAETVDNIYMPTQVFLGVNGPYTWTGNEGDILDNVYS